MKKELYVGSISSRATEEDLQKLFSISGTVTSIHLIRDVQSGEFKGCGYVRMATPEQAKDAIETLDGAFLIDKVKEDHIPVVFHIELSNEQMCNSISEATGAKSELLNAVHNVSDTDFKAGATYISLMEHNVQVLKEALN